MVNDFSEFEQKYPDMEWLESRDGFSRYSNGLEPDTEDESVWFCDSCESVVSHPDTGAGCQNCDEDE